MFVEGGEVYFINLNWVASALIPRVTADNSPNPLRSAFDDAMLLDTLPTIF